MSHYKSAEEVRAEHLAVLGPDLGEAYHALYNEVAWLHLNWRQYRELFGTSPERVDLLNEAAALFTTLLHGWIWEATLLHLSRLTDSPRSAGKANLTIRGLPVLVPDPELRADVQSKVDAAVAACAFARDWRNRHIAHKDLSLALERPAADLAFASRADVQTALAALEAPLLAIEQHYFRTTVMFSFAREYGDALDLLYVLRDGLNAAHARSERLKAGNFLPEDWHQPPPL